LRFSRRFYNAFTNSYARLISAICRSGHSPFPLVVNCILTYDCNMTCPFCISDAGRKRAPKASINAEKWANIFRQIPSLTVIGFSGGEVFCHPQVHEILRYASIGHRTAIVTNGTFLDDETVHRLVQLGAQNFLKKGLVQIGISVNEDIDGYEKCKAVLDEKIRIFEKLASEKSRQKKRFPQLELKVLIRDDVAPFLDLFASAIQYSPIEAVTFQMLTTQAFSCFTGFDINDRNQIEAMRNYKDKAPGLNKFSKIAELEKSFERLLSLPKSIRNKIGFLPPISIKDFLDYYRGEMNPDKFFCVSPWMHWTIDPYGVAYQCINPEGIDLKEIPFRKAWNDPKMRALRREVREKKLFNRCLGCCFLTPI